MNVRLYKFAIITEIILAIIIGIDIYMNPFWKNQEILKIRAIHPNEFYFAFAILLVLLIISFLISLLITTIFKSAQIIQKGQPENYIKKLRNFNFWKFTFYSNLTFSACLLLYGLFVKLTGNESILVYDIHNFINEIMFIYILVIILSFVIGVLLLTTNVLWKTNKLPAYITLIIGISLFTSPFISAFGLKKNCEYFNYLENNPTSAVEGTATTYVDEEEFNNEEVQENENLFTFSELWENPSEDEINVKQVIKLLINENLTSNGQSNLGEIRSKFNYYITEKFDQSDTIIKRNFNKINDKIQRDPQKIKDAFDNYSYLFYNLVNTKLYIKTNLDGIIDILLHSYYDIQSNEDPNLLLGEIYEVMIYAKKENLGLNDEYYYNLIEAAISQKVKDKYDEIYYGDGSEMTKEDMVWAYSFWARRHQEKNADVVFEILKEIKNNYDNNDK